MIKIFLVLLSFSLSSGIPYYKCDDQIFCHGKLLHTAQMSKLYDYSKTFVDHKMTNTRDVVMQNFDIFMFKNAQKPNPARIRKFLRENFEDGEELEMWTPSDYNNNPSWLSNIHDTRVRKFAYDLLQVIPKLSRKVRRDVYQHPEHYSFIAVPNGVVIAGGLNKEMYYLDSYWIIKGLLVNDMTTTVKGILDNFIRMEKKYGYIPRGTRIYYCTSWQPPVLAILTGLYMQQTNDIYWLKENIETLNHELRHWLNYRCMNIKRNGVSYTLARYTNSHPFPRPERYREDYEECSIFENEEKIGECYANLNAYGGSGWYYPERYIFHENDTDNASIAYSQPRRLLPVDLNVYLCRSFKMMASFYEKLNDNENATYYRSKYIHWVSSIQAVLFSSTDGIWYDYDIGRHRQRPYCYPTNFSPLWGEIFDKHTAQMLGKKALGYFKKMNMMPFRGSSNAEPDPKNDLMKMSTPFKHMVAMGLYKSGHPEAQDFVKEFIKRWLRQSIDCECCKYDLYDDVGTRSTEFRLGCGWIIFSSLDLIKTFFVDSNISDFDSIWDD